MARKCWFKGNEKWMKWNWTAQRYRREKKKSRWIGRDKREENVLVDEETPEDEKGRKKKTIEKILRKISAWKSEGKGWRYVILW